MTKEELKRDFFKWHYEHQEAIPADIADWWLAKLEEATKEVVGEAIIVVVYGCAEYTNMHQDTDNENVAVNTVRAKILKRLDGIKYFHSKDEECEFKCSCHNGSLGTKDFGNTCGVCGCHSKDKTINKDN